MGMSPQVGGSLD